MIIQDKKDAVLRLLALFGAKKKPPTGLYFEGVCNWLKEQFPELENEPEYENDIQSVLNQFEQEGLIQSQQISEQKRQSNNVIATVSRIFYIITPLGKEKNSLINNSDITNYLLNEKEKDILLLNVIINGINGYGKISYSTFNDTINHIVDAAITSKKEQNRIGDPWSAERIFNFLKENGFIKQSSEREYKFTKRGKKLIEVGDYDKFVIHENTEKDKEIERIEREDLSIKYQAENSIWQKKWGNKFTVASIVIAFFSMVTSISITYYVTKMQIDNNQREITKTQYEQGLKNLNEYVLNTLDLGSTAALLENSINDTATTKDYIRQLEEIQTICKRQIENPIIMDDSVARMFAKNYADIITYKYKITKLHSEQLPVANDSFKVWTRQLNSNLVSTFRYSLQYAEKIKSSVVNNDFHAAK